MKSTCYKILSKSIYRLSVFTLSLMYFLWIHKLSVTFRATILFDKCEKLLLGQLAFCRLPSIGCFWRNDIHPKLAQATVKIFMRLFSFARYWATSLQYHFYEMLDFEAFLESFSTLVKLWYKVLKGAACEHYSNLVWINPHRKYKSKKEALGKRFHSGKDPVFSVVLS